MDVAIGIDVGKIGEQGCLVMLRKVDGKYFLDQFKEYKPPPRWPCPNCGDRLYHYISGGREWWACQKCLHKQYKDPSDNKKCILCSMPNELSGKLCSTCRLEIYHEVAMENVEKIK